MFVQASNNKGAVAEAAIALAAARLGLRVLRPLADGARYDLAFDVAGSLLRVQCKWAALEGDVLKISTRGSYFTPGRGYVTSSYTAADVDGIAAYCDALDRCYWLPIAKFDGHTQVFLRLNPARNNQRGGVNMAAEYEFGAVAQLGERRAGSAKVRGSSPLSSTFTQTLGAHEFRERFGWYMERAAAGETFVITRRGRPLARLSPADAPAPAALADAVQG